VFIGNFFQKERSFSRKFFFKKTHPLIFMCIIAIIGVKAEIYWCFVEYDIDPTSYG